MNGAYNELNLLPGIGENIFQNGVSRGQICSDEKGCNQATGKRPSLEKTHYKKTKEAPLPNSNRKHPPVLRDVFL